MVSFNFALFCLAGVDSRPLGMHQTLAQLGKPPSFASRANSTIYVELPFMLMHCFNDRDPTRAAENRQTPKP